jgi:Zn-dependent peptidase ImmA (M78 family)
MSAPPLHGGERAAREARRKYGLDITQPIPNLLDIAEDLFDVPVLIDRFGDDKIAGVLLRNGGDAFIAVNADHGAVRQRFTLAHELGHLHMQHQPRVEMVADLFEASRDPQEVEANYFAAEFLAPRAAVTAWLEDREMLDCVARPSTTARLALHFGIAFSAASYRLERTGAISARAKKQLAEELRTEGTELARQYGRDRLMDAIEVLWRERNYPRVPRQTAAFAERARADGLLNEEEFSAIVGAPPEIDLADWLT